MIARQSSKGEFKLQFGFARLIAHILRSRREETERVEPFDAAPAVTFDKFSCFHNPPLAQLVSASFSPSSSASKRRRIAGTEVRNSLLKRRDKTLRRVLKRGAHLS